MLQGLYTLCMSGNVMIMDQKNTNSVPGFDFMPFEII
jgi:hypothetical protein